MVKSSDIEDEDEVMKPADTLEQVIEGGSGDDREAGEDQVIPAADEVSQVSST